MIKDVNAVDNFNNSDAGEKLKGAIKRRGLQCLAFRHNVMKQMSANRPLIKPEDAQGLKFRVQASDVLVAQFEQLGANPQKMSFKEVYGGLQTKVIDGQENTWSNIYGKKFFEVQDGITETNHGIIDYLVVTSTEWWEGLPGDVRDQLSKILKEVTDVRNADSTAVNERNKKNIIEAGGVVRTLTPEQRQAWVDALKPVWKKFEGDIGADLIQAAAKSNR
jgi:C4-dicarboxylate-binding protein DctP